MTASPCVGIRLPPEKPASLLTVLTTADIHAMAGAVHERYAALIMFGAATGLRPGELSASPRTGSGSFRAAWSSTSSLYGSPRASASGP